MRHISEKIRNQLEVDPLMGQCFRWLALRDHECKGRITWEHGVIYAGRQLDEVWAIFGLCEYAHSVGVYQNTGIYNRNISEWIAVNRMTPADERKYPKRDWDLRRRYLNSKYGQLHLPKTV